MRGWTVGDKVIDDRGNTGTITGLTTLGAWVSVRGRVNCIGWGPADRGGMPDREEYDRRRAERAAGPLFASKATS